MLKTPQHTGIVKRKNRTTQDMIRVMLNIKNMAHSWWAEAANTEVHIINRFYFRPLIEETFYEIWKGKKTKLSYFYIFGSKRYILNDKEQLKKFDGRDNEGLFPGYSVNYVQQEN